MANPDNGFEQMFDMWKESQETFLKVQKDIADNFQKSINEVATTPGSDEEAMANWQNFIKSWAPNWDPAAAMGQPAADMFTKGNDAFLAMLDPANWTSHAPEQLRTILQSIAAGPQFADLATPQVEAANAWREVLDYQQAATDMAKILQEAWGVAYTQFSESHTLEDFQSGKVQAAVDAWLKAANATLLETQRSAPFMNAQKRLLRASMEIKARQRDMAETWSEAYQIPTRTEVDDLIRIVHELRREVRQLKRDVSAAKAGAKT